MKTIRDQAEKLGHAVAGKLRREKDAVFKKNGEVICYKIYRDSEGTEYAVNWRGDLVYIAGEDWVI